MRLCMECVTEYEDTGPDGYIPHVLRAHPGSYEWLVLTDWLLKALLPDEEGRE